MDLNNRKFGLPSNAQSNVSPEAISQPSEIEDGISEQLAREVLDAIDADQELKAAIIKCIHDGECEGLNDSLGPYVRTTHRGKRAEEQSLRKLGVELEKFSFEWEPVDDQFRFINLNRYKVPVRLLLVRANEVGGCFKIWKKGPRAKELMNENRTQLVLFEFVVTQPRKRRKDGQAISPPKRFLNVWIIADASSEANKNEDGIKIHLAIPTGIRRGTGKDWVAKQTLNTPVRKMIWEGSLGAPMLSPQDLPAAAPIVVEAPLRRVDTGEEAVA